MSTITTADIPTLSQLYQSKNLKPAVLDSNSNATTPKPSQSLNDRVGLIRGDITRLGVDAIVNAANNSLLGGGGVDGVIHNVAGPDLLRECRALKGCYTGSAKITNAYKLPCKKVIHAVGPVYDAGIDRECAKRLEGCYATSLRLAAEAGCKSIAFSALSTGMYGYPSYKAAAIAIGAVKEFLEGEQGNRLERVIFCTFVMKDVEAYHYWLPRILPAVETDSESDWEEVEGGASAENGPPPA